MSLKIFVKVGAISNLSDARYCAAMGVDILGFRTDTNDPAYVDQTKLEQIVGWTAGPKICAEIGENLPQDMSNFDYIQTESLEQVRLLNIAEDKIIFKATIDQLDSNVLQKLKSIGIRKLIVEAPSLAHLNIEKLDGFEVIIQTNSNLDEIKSATSSANIIGIAMDGSIEEKPGFKTYDELSDTLEFFEE